VETCTVTYARYSQVTMIVCKREKYLPGTSATSQSAQTIGRLVVGQETGRTESNLSKICNGSLDANLDEFTSLS